jgi:sigma-B regulation protein RsbU (phosphoserine phosphatase)
MQTIIRRSLKAANAEQGVITLVDRREEQPTGVTLVRTMMSSSDHTQFHLNQNLVGWMQLNKKPLISDDVRNDDRFRGVQWDAEIRSLLCVPLMVKSELTGVLAVINKKGAKTFSDDDQRLLAILASQSAQIVENARLYEAEREFVKMQEEVRLAAKIQSDLLPRAAPSLSGYEIAGKNIPAQVVGGDYFDFIALDEHRVAICLADVSGKGLPASLLMSNTQATIRSQTLVNATPSECLTRANILLYRTTSPEKFVTLFYGILDTKTHGFTYSNAGHDSPYFMASSQFSRLETGGTVLGVIEPFDYEQDSVTLASADTIVIYSDGITESFNEKDEPFGEERIEAVLKQHQKATASAIVDEIINAAKKFAGRRQQADDMTVVVIKRTT